VSVAPQGLGFGGFVAAGHRGGWGGGRGTDGGVVKRQGAASIVGG
jgi:hypothetical protein